MVAHRVSLVAVVALQAEPAARLPLPVARQDLLHRMQSVVRLLSQAVSAKETWPVGLAHWSVVLAVRLVMVALLP